MKDAFRFSIKHLLLWTAVVALFCMALKNASAAWASAMLGVALVVLATVVLLAIFRRGAVRAYWIGFALFGWLYVALLMYGGTFSDNQLYHPLRPDSLATSQLSAWTYQRVFPWIKKENPEPTATGGPIAMDDPFADPGSFGSAYATPGPPRGPYQHDFVNVGHAFWTLLLAACGGALARWFYLTGPGRPADPGGEAAPRAATKQIAAENRQ